MICFAEIESCSIIKTLGEHIEMRGLLLSEPSFRIEYSGAKALHQKCVSSLCAPNADGDWWRAFAVASGVYQILNLVNGHCYIGRAYDLKKRKRDHFDALRKGKYGISHWQNAFNKYGEKAFRFIVLDYIEDRKTLGFWEQVYFFLLKPEYNSNPIALKPPDHTGRRRSAETCHKMSKTRKERLHSGEIILALEGRTWEEFYGPEEATRMKQRLSEAGRGKHGKGKTLEEIHGPKRAAEIKQKISRTHIEKEHKGKTYEQRYGPERAAEIRQTLTGERNPHYGDHRTWEERFGLERAAEIKQKISKALKKYWREVRAGKRKRPKHRGRQDLCNF